MPCTSVVAGFTGYRGYRGPVLHFIGDPVTKEPEKNYEYFEDGLLVVLRGKVVACKDAVEAIKELGDDLELVDCSDKVRGIYFRWTRKQGIFDRVPVCYCSCVSRFLWGCLCLHRVLTLGALSLSHTRVHTHMHSPPLAAHHARIRRLPCPLPAD